MRSDRFKHGSLAAQVANAPVRCMTGYKIEVPVDETWQPSRSSRSAGDTNSPCKVDAGAKQIIAICG